MLKREIEDFLPEVAKTFPVIAIVGLRQSGKTTLCRNFFLEKPYISFENPDNKERFDTDPRGFLSNYVDDSGKVGVDLRLHTATRGHLRGRGLLF